MKIPVIYESYNIARPPLLFGDQVMMKDLLDRPEFDTTVGINSRFEGAIVSLPLHHNEQYMDNLNADISKLKWVLLILTANEFGSDAYKKIEHPNMKIWLQTPKESDEADKFLPLGYPTKVSPKGLSKKYDWFFSGQVNNPDREACYKQLERMEGGKLVRTAGFWQGFEHPEYIKYMAQAKIIPCPSGPETPDTFRLYEALELGCIPVVDNPWYWGKLFGKHPIPTVKSWEDLPSVIENPPNFDISFWWERFKEQLVHNLFEDIAELRSRV